MQLSLTGFRAAIAAAIGGGTELPMSRPKSLPVGNKYKPHQGKQECARRRERQLRVSS